jgi:hypothetical protein
MEFYFIDCSFFVCVFCFDGILFINCSFFLIHLVVSVAQCPYVRRDGGRCNQSHDQRTPNVRPHAWRR